MNRIASHVAVGVAGIAIGWFAGREYMQMQIAELLAHAAASFGAKVDPVPAPPTTAAAIAAPAPDPRALLGKIEISSATLVPPKNSYAGPTLSMLVKNGTDRTLAAVSFNFALTSPGREVPWDQQQDEYVSIPGGIAPGETAKADDIGSMGLYLALSNAMKAHPDAVLALSVQDAYGADRKSITK